VWGGHFFGFCFRERPWWGRGWVLLCPEKKSTFPPLPPEKFLEPSSPLGSQKNHPKKKKKENNKKSHNPGRKTEFLPGKEGGKSKRPPPQKGRKLAWGPSKIKKKNLGVPFVGKRTYPLSESTTQKQTQMETDGGEGGRSLAPFTWDKGRGILFLWVRVAGWGPSF